MQAVVHTAHVLLLLLPPTIRAQPCWRCRPGDVKECSACKLPAAGSQHVLCAQVRSKHCLQDFDSNSWMRGDLPSPKVGLVDTQLRSTVGPDL
jgi:hypothetical protein